MMGINIFVGAFIAGVLSNICITWVRKRSPIGDLDTAKFHIHRFYAAPL